MSQRHNYLLVEGQQDVFFIGRLLQELGLKAVQAADQVPAKWIPFLDEATHQRDQERRAKGKAPTPFWQMFKPACLFNETCSVLIEAVGGYRTKFAETLRATNALIDGGLSSLNGVGLIPDADTNSAASLSSSQEALRAVGLSVPNFNEAVIQGPLNTGIFVLPGGIDTGGLEEVLFACGETIYPQLMAGAKVFIDGVDLESTLYTPKDLEEIKTPQGSAKAVIGSVASVLKPGSTIQVSVLRDRWVSAPTITIPRVAALVTFLKSLCEIP